MIYVGKLTDKYCIVGVGETAYTKNSGKTIRAMGTEAIRNAIIDAGITPADVNGMLSYQMGDSTPSPEIAADLGIRLDFFTDASGGGSSTEHDGLRMVANLVDERFDPETEDEVAIGKRVEVVFQDISEGFTLPQFRLSDELPRGSVWRFPS